MKILASKHLEAQIDWFAKRGFSCLGALIIFGSSSESTDNDILYHFFISDDTTQDTDAINTAKHFLYKVILPKYGMKKVHFRCDGAAAFNCTKAKVAMPMWFQLTDEKIVEVSYKVSVSGGGKTSLDGHFGIMTQHLKRLVNYGHGYSTAEELYNLLVEFPLRFSEFHLYQPKRKHLIHWPTTKRIDNLGLKMFYLLEYDHEQKRTEGFYHSRHSRGIHLEAVDEQCMKLQSAKEEVESSGCTSSDENSNDDSGRTSDLQNLLDNINCMTVVQLREKCRVYELVMSGKKALLQARLRNKVSELLEARQSDESECSQHGSFGEDSSVDRSGHDSSWNQASRNPTFLFIGDEDDSDEEEYHDQLEEDDEEDEGFDSESDTSDDSRQSSIVSGIENAEARQEEDHIDIYDPWIHIMKSTWSESDAITGERGSHSKIDYMTRRLQKNDDFMGKKNKKFAKMNDDQINLLLDAGVHVCTAVNEDTKERCTCQFRFRSGLEKHMKKCQEGKTNHIYPKQDLLSNVLLDATNGKWALALACGSMQNRCRALSQHVEIQDGVEGLEGMAHELVSDDWHDNGCYRRDIRERVNFRASLELVKDLQILYLAGERRDGGGEKKNASKYTPAQAIARLANMKDDAGRRKYSYREGNPNGPLPTEAYVRSWFSRQKSNKKKEKCVSDEYDSMDIEDLKKMCNRELFDGKNTRPRDYIIKMLMLDDLHRDENDIGEYETMTTKQLNEIRKAKELPTANTKKSFKYILRMRDKVNATREHTSRVQNQFENVLAITDAMENMHSAS